MYGITVAHKTNNKFGAKKSEYNGVIYDSTKEAVFARHLDVLHVAKDPKERVVHVIRQYKFDFHVKGINIFTYICDFKVAYMDGTHKYFDVKGYKKGAAYNIFVIKKKCIEAQYNIVINEA